MSGLVWTEKMFVYVASGVTDCCAGGGIFLFYAQGQVGGNRRCGKENAESPAKGSKFLPENDIHSEICAVAAGFSTEFVVNIKLL